MNVCKRNFLLTDYLEETIMDEAIRVVELYGVLKMGFYLCIKSSIDVGEKANELGDSNVNNDRQLNDVHEIDEQLHTVTEAFLDTSEVEIGPYVENPWKTNGMTLCHINQISN